MSSAAPHGGASTAAASSSSSSSAAAAVATCRHYFCHKCFLASELPAGAAVCFACHSTFLEEIDLPRSENLSRFFPIASLALSPAYYVLRSHADANTFFHSDISPLGHLMHLPWPPEHPLDNLEVTINRLLESGARAYVVLVGMTPPPFGPGSKDTVEAEHGWIASQVTEGTDCFISPAALWAVAALKDALIDEGAGGEASCAVCWEDLPAGAAVKQLPCQHVFHSKCIFPWLQLKHTCPNCRYPLPTEEVGGPIQATAFWVTIPPRWWGLNLAESIKVVCQNVIGKVQTPPR